jgi:hypothetical protein
MKTLPQEFTSQEEHAELQAAWKARQEAVMAAFRKHGTASKTGSFLLSHSEPHHPSCICDDGCSWKLQRKVWEECE